MKVEVLYFGVMREKLGSGREIVDLPSGSTVASLLEVLGGRLGTDNRGAGSIRVAVNREYVDSGHALSDNDEVALIPPVSGG